MKVNYLISSVCSKDASDMALSMGIKLGEYKWIPYENFGNARTYALRGLRGYKENQLIGLFSDEETKRLMLIPEDQLITVIEPKKIYCCKATVCITQYDKTEFVYDEVEVIKETASSLSIAAHRTTAFEGRKRIGRDELNRVIKNDYADRISRKLWVTERPDRLSVQHRLLESIDSEFKIRQDTLTKLKTEIVKLESQWLVESKKEMAKPVEK